MAGRRSSLDGQRTHSLGMEKIQLKGIFLGFSQIIFLEA